jgi:membrane protein DedA with SNARE-associated domain/membrane-associated phospholipid phosphatase
VTAAAFAALGRVNIYVVIGAAAAGAILGDNAGYWFGRKGGIALVRRFGRYVRLDERKIERVHGFFDRHGSRTVFIGRFVPLLRSWAAVLAGVAHMPYRTFLLYNALGGVVWATLFGTLGYAFGHNLPRLERYVGQATLAVALLIALVAGLFVAGRWFEANRARLSARVSAWRQRTADAPRVAAFGRKHARVWLFITARFARGEYLGLHLTVGLLVSLAALWLFGGVTEDVIHNDPLTRFDVSFGAALRAHATRFGYAAFDAISLLGSPVVVGALGVVVGIVLLLRREWIVLSGWLAAFAGAGVLGWALKQAIRRPRPAYGSEYLHGASFSFPSNHALGALVAYGMLAYVIMSLGTERPRARTAVATVAVILILAIGFSRLYLGVHYFSDVVGGYAAGAVWLSACISGVEVARRQRDVPSRHEDLERVPGATPTGGA